MRYVIYEETSNNPVVRLSLRHTRDDGVMLIAVDESGRRVSQGSLLELNKHGRLERYRAVNTDLGFDLDDQERIKLEED